MEFIGAVLDLSFDAIIKYPDKKPLVGVLGRLLLSQRTLLQFPAPRLPTPAPAPTPSSGLFKHITLMDAHILHIYMLLIYIIKSLQRNLGEKDLF